MKCKTTHQPRPIMETCHGLETNPNEKSQLLENETSVPPKETRQPPRRMIILPTANRSKLHSNDNQQNERNDPQNPPDDSIGIPKQRLSIALLLLPLRRRRRRTLRPATLPPFLSEVSFLTYMQGIVGEPPPEEEHPMKPPLQHATEPAGNLHRNRPGAVGDQKKIP